MCDYDCGLCFLLLLLLCINVYIICPQRVKLLHLLIKRDSCAIRGASERTGLFNVTTWSLWSSTHQMPLKLWASCGSLCRICVCLCVRERGSKRGREGERGYGDCGKQLRNCLSLSVQICPFCTSLSLSSASTVGPTLAWLGAMRG